MNISRNMIVKLVLIICLLHFHCSLATSPDTVLLEAEQGKSTGELRYRESASNGESVYLNHGEYISVSFKTYAQCTAIVLNVRYSEGSAVDTATVSIDGKVIGRFRTTTTSHSTDPWNDFYDSGNVGSEITLKAGEHTVKITVSTIDEYGMEVDYIQLKTTCKNATDENEDVSSQMGTDAGNEPNSLSVGWITAITLSVIALALTVLVWLVHVYRRRKQRVIRKKSKSYDKLPNKERSERLPSEDSSERQPINKEGSEQLPYSNLKIPNKVE